MEDQRKKSITLSNVALSPTLLQPPSIHHGISEAERTYIFTTNIADPQLQVAPGLLGNTVRSTYSHSRSLSHGGGALGAPGTPSRPSALKSSIKGGHQRALSQGQIHEAHSGGSQRGHSRVGSKTDFILPPSHKEADEFREPSVISGRGHTRQASRSESIYTLRRQDLPPWWKRFIFFRTSRFDEHGFRQLVPNHTVPAKTPKREHPNSKFVCNKIRTTKYTLLSFIPKNLLEQFHRVANLYFVFVQVLNWIPALQVFGKEIAMLPLIFVLGVTAIKDLFEDRRRRTSDKRINNSTCRVYHGETERYIKIRWQDLRVGDIVHLSNNETVPADILMLRSSEHDGFCYIETCDLDGETNLKRRQVVRGFQEKQNLFSPSKFVSKLEIDPPTTKTYRFHGAVVHPSGERVPVSTESLLLRESRLKNSDFVEGIVVYAGHETKAMLNNSGPRYKRSQLEQKMNIDVVWCVLILLILCSVGAIGNAMWLTRYVDVNVPFFWFLKNDAGIMETPVGLGVLTFFSLIIIFQILIPLALYVTIEVCKVLQVYHIHRSLDLYDSHTNKRAECRAMNITEELGQIQYVFSDKTGTLTENRMLFRRCTIAGIDYNHPPTEEEKFLLPHSPIPAVIPNTNLQDDLLQSDHTGRLTLHAQRCKEFFLVLSLCNTVVVNDAPHRDTMNASGLIENEPRVTFVKPSDPLMSSDSPYLRLSESRSITPSPIAILPLKPQTQHVPSLSPISSSAESTPSSESPPMRIKAISPTDRVKSIVSKLPMVPQILANTRNKKFSLNSKAKLIAASSKSRLNKVLKPIYEAESPDELALVNSALAYDAALINRNMNSVLINEPGEGVAEFEILKVLPFDSVRKCMSIVVRRISGPGYSQDVIMYTKGADSTILGCLAPCSSDSEEALLRDQTLNQLELYARQGLRVLLIAKRVLNPVEFSEWYTKHQECEMSMEGREKRVRDSYALLERNLTLLGATGIEDRLQEQVPETISALLSAGIVVWVLTGDKTETAINVAYSAKLFHSQMEILKLTARSRDAAETSINFYLNEIEIQLRDANDNQRKLNKKNRALVVDGKTLTFILDLRSNLTKPFLELTKYCTSVLCCRSTPLQKAFLIKVVKEELKVSTLAIGDGANDVSMIQMADVGVGICGQEGMQAVMASDFAIAKFKILEKLLLVHGHLNYDRLAKLIIYYFYKNATFVFVLFWFQLYNGFSGSVMMEQMYVMIFNFVFTSLPPIAIGAYEKRLHENLLTRTPKLYRYGRLGKGYRNQFWLCMLDSLYQSLVMFFVTVGAYYNYFSTYGSDIGIWDFGATITSACLITMLCHFALDVRTWTKVHVGSIVVSLVSFYVIAFGYNSGCQTNCMGLPNTFHTIHHAMSSVIYYLVLILTPAAALLPRLFVRAIKNTLHPADDVIVRVEQINEKKRGENLLVSWSSRSSTSGSSIFRTSDQRDKSKTIKTIS